MYICVKYLMRERHLYVMFLEFSPRLRVILNSQNSCDMHHQPKWAQVAYAWHLSWNNYMESTQKKIIISTVVLATKSPQTLET
jgi:hypothetical protein